MTGKIIQVCNERIEYLNEWLEKTKEVVKTNPATAANAESVKVVLYNFKRLQDIASVLFNSPSKEAIAEANELLPITLEELINHNTSIQGNYKKMISALTEEINKSVAPMETEQKVLDSYVELEAGLSEQLETYKQARTQLIMLIDRATGIIEKEAAEPQEENTQEENQSENPEQEDDLPL